MPVMRLFEMQLGVFPQALKNFNLSVAKGERIVICGPSGSGKSTLVHCINKLDERQEGSINVLGTEIDDDVSHIDRVKIPEHAEKYPGELSGGQQRRVAIARALRISRFNWFCDEGTDQDYHRGQCAWDKYKTHGAGVKLHKVVDGPFVAIEVSRSILGTKGGARAETVLANASARE